MIQINVRLPTPSSGRYAASQTYKRLLQEVDERLISARLAEDILLAARIFLAVYSLRQVIEKE